MRFLLIAAAILLGGCASTATPPPALPQLQPAPAGFGAPLSLMQRLTVQQAPDSPELEPSERQLDTLLQVDGDRLRLVALALGQRVLSLDWDGQTLQVQRHPLLPASVDAARVLRDIALVFAPVEALRPLLGSGWTLSEEGALRVLAHEGRPQLLVHYRRGRSEVEIDNRAERYRLRIESRSQEGG